MDERKTGTAPDSQRDVTEGRETVNEIAKMRAELDELRAFKRRVDEWMYPTSYYKLFVREFEAAKSPTSSVETCTRAGLQACIYRCIELCANCVSGDERAKVRKMLPS